jgi:hypothetical protein
LLVDSNSKIIIRNKDEVFVHIDCTDGVSYELREHFTFMVPGYQFTPQYKARLWDGKIRLFDSRTKQMYRGLVPYIAKFCEERNYDWDYENDAFDEEFSLVEANEFIKMINPKLDMDQGIIKSMHLYMQFAQDVLYYLAPLLVVSLLSFIFWLVFFNIEV